MGMALVHCKYFVERKKRFCKLAPMPDSEYCGEHQPAGVVTKRGRRVPCPYDPSHSVFETDLPGHLPICNSRPRENAYATEDVNLVQDRSTGLSERLSIIGNEDLVHRIVGIVEPFVERFLQDTPLNAPEVFKDLPRNDAQTKGIAIQLDTSNIGDYSLVEVGAGKAKLAHQFVLQNKSNLPKRVYLIDRSRPRAKMDRKIENLCGHAERIDCDLKDVDFVKLPLDTPSVVVVAKHACGEATCFSLVALANVMKAYPEKRFYLALAPCCHQVCNFSSFCNREILTELGIDSSMFTFIARMSSWSVCAIANDDVIGVHKKSELGRMMKLFIDICRTRYLQKFGLTAELRVYCEEQLSPENRVIVARSSI